MDQDSKTNTIDIFNKDISIAWRLSAVDPAAAIEHAESLNMRANALNYKKGKAWALLIKARGSLMVSDFEIAKTAVHDAITLFQKYKELTGLAEAFLLESYIFLQQGSLDRALEDATKTLEIAKSCEHLVLEAKAENSIGEVLVKAGAIQEGLEYLIQASDSLKKIETTSTEGKALSGISQTDQAGIGDEILELQARLFSNLGNAFLGIGEANNAIDYFELALQSAEQNQDQTSQIVILKGLSTAYRRNGDRAKAKQFLFQSIELAQNAKHDVMLLELYLEQALILIEADIYPEAIEILSRIITEGEKNQLIPILAEAYRLRALAHELVGDFASALEDYKQFHKNEESISSERIAQSKRDAEILFELERAKNEAEIYRLKNVELREHKEELEQSNKRLKVVMEIGRVVTASLDIQEIAHTVHASLSQLMDASGFALAQYDETHNQIHFIMFIEEGKNYDPFTITADSKDSFAAYVIHKRELIKLDNVEKEYKDYVENAHHLGGRKTKSIICAPLILGGKVLGAVSVQSIKEKAYNDEDAELLRSVSSFIAVAMENSRNHEELLRLNQALRSEKEALEQLTKKVSRLANHDGLTGLPNRLLLGELLEKSIVRAARNETIVAVLFMDLDNFKPINDQFGHHAGDLVLIEVAHRLKRALRAMDIIARVGGDEFVALLTDVEDEKAASIVAEKLLDALKEPIHVQNIPCVLGVSIGIAFFPKDGKQGDELLHRADEAMYQIKRENKNGYTFYKRKG